MNESSVNRHETQNRRQWQRYKNHLRPHAQNASMSRWPIQHVKKGAQWPSTHDRAGESDRKE